MGELGADELAKLMTWWRRAYEEANEVLDVGGSFGTIVRTPAQRQAPSKSVSQQRLTAA